MEENRRLVRSALYASATGEHKLAVLDMASLQIVAKAGPIKYPDGIAYDSADLTMLPTTTVPLESEGDARKVLRLIDALEEHDDVQNVYANFDIPDSVLQAVEA